MADPQGSAIAALPVGLTKRLPARPHKAPTGAASQSAYRRGLTKRQPARPHKAPTGATGRPVRSHTQKGSGPRSGSTNSGWSPCSGHRGHIGSSCSWTTSWTSCATSPGTCSAPAGHDATQLLRSARASSRTDSASADIAPVRSRSFRSMRRAVAMASSGVIRSVCISASAGSMALAAAQGGLHLASCRRVSPFGDINGHAHVRRETRSPP
jgi:hypothetical protein